jgi:hypothetical protein
MRILSGNFSWKGKVQIKNFLAVLCVIVSSHGGVGDISLRVKQDRPFLSWSNTNGLEFQLLRSANLPGEWDSIVRLTGDAREIRWLDESNAPGQSFYRWEIEDPDARVHKLQSALNRACRAAAVPGAVAAVITTNGIWVGTSGVSDKAIGTQIEPQMRFGIGSLSKSMVAATILQLEDEGRLSIEDPLKKWVHDFPHVTNTITLRQLLNHTSGVYDLTDSWDWYHDTIANPGQRFTVEELWKYIQEPYFAPGTAFHYSNTGYIILGLVIEAVTGRRVTEEYRRRFIEPLGLTSVYMERQSRAPATWFTPTAISIRRGPFWILRIFHELRTVRSIGPPEDCSPMCSIPHVGSRRSGAANCFRTKRCKRCWCGILSRDQNDTGSQSGRSRQHAVNSSCIAGIFRVSAAMPGIRPH